jgi:DMSO/TMAO reductase YedYZ molybdopterin-dependent catalytic subunit
MAEGWLPPDQTPTRKWPVVGERAPSPAALDLESATVEFTGLVVRPRVILVRELIARGTQRLEMDVHCVTRWSHRAMCFLGLPLATLLDEVGVSPEATYVRFTAWSERDHDTGLPLEVARRDTWLVHGTDAGPLEIAHGFPLRTVTPGRYFYKSLKWLRRVELLAAPAPGYWERADGYHENADPWPGNERYVSGSVPPETLARFRAATDFAPYAGRTLRGLDLRGWRPAATDLRGLKLKDCDFRGADLSGLDLRGANLTMGNLRGADLRDADLRDADLEGAWLAGADLRGADLRGAFLTAASLVEGDTAARVDAARFAGASGLLEAQRAFLVGQAVAEPPGGD